MKKQDKARFGNIKFQFQFHSKLFLVVASCLETFLFMHLNRITANDENDLFLFAISLKPSKNNKNMRCLKTLIKSSQVFMEEFSVKPPNESVPE